MYTLPSKLKLFAIIFMVVGALGMLAGFLTVPSTTAEVKEMMDAHGDGHGGDHGETATHDGAKGTHGETHGENAAHDTVKENQNATHGENAHDSEEAHLTHVLHQLQNRPWSALYIASFFFFMIALGTLAFYAIQHVAQAGWSPVLFRVMEGITAYLPWASVIIIILLLLSVFHVNHIFHWMDGDLINPDSPKYDKLIAGKSGWLNPTWFIIRACIYLIGFNAYRYLSRK